jgi:hypothetical protein
MRYKECFLTSFEPERGVTSITPLPVNPYAEELLVKTVKSFQILMEANFVLKKTFIIVHTVN